MKEIDLQYVVVSLHGPRKNRLETLRKLQENKPTLEESSNEKIGLLRALAYVAERAEGEEKTLVLELISLLNPEVK